MPTEMRWTPPDGGWGWVIVFCSLTLHALCLGVTITLSVMYVSWLDAFEDGRGVTSWVISICIAVTFGAGPIPAALARRYGFRTVTVISGLLTSTGHVLSYFATSVAHLVITIGLISGMGCCFAYLTAVAVVSEYFSKRRSVAMGIATSGVGIGSLIAAPILNILIDMYGWRGTLLITGAVSLHMSVCGILIRPLEKTLVYTEDQVALVDPTHPSLDVENEEDKNYHELNEKNDADKDSISQRKCFLRLEDKHYSNSTLNSALADNETPKEKNGFLHNVQDSQRKKKPGIADSMVNVHYRKHLMDELIVRPFMSLKDLRGSRRSMDRVVSRHVLNVKNSMDALFLGRLKQNEYQSIRDDFPDDFPKNGTLTAQVVEVGGVEKYTMNSGDTCSEHAAPGCFASYKNSMAETVRMNVNLLKDPVFFQFAMSTIVTNLSYITPMMYLVDRAIDCGLDRNVGTILIALTGVGGIFGRVFFGMATYKLFQDRVMTYIAILVLGGAFTMLSPLCGSSVALHSIYAALIGCFIGGYSTMAAVVTADIMGLSRAMESFGLLMTFMGLASLVGPPFAGLLFDLTRTYVFSYILFGFFLLFSGLMMLPYAIKRRREGLHKMAADGTGSSQKTDTEDTT